MKIEFEFETKIDTGSGKKEKKFSLSDIKKKAKEIAKDAAAKSNEAVVKIVTNASEVCDEALCKIADFAQATVYAIDDYLATTIESEKSFEEKLAEIPTDENLTLAELLDLLEVYSEEESVTDTVNTFFANINYPASEISYDAFVSVVSMDKITYDAVAEKIAEAFENISEEEIISVLIEDFNEWLKNCDEITEICSKPNLRFLLMYFAKKNKEVEESEE